jgi:hypothetical protein
MSRYRCCCGKVAPKPESFCCNPLLFTDFITLFGDNMSTHAEVSPFDWIALYVPRNSFNTSNTSLLTTLNSPSAGCNCCCESEEDQCNTFPQRSQQIQSKKSVKLSKNLKSFINGLKKYYKTDASSYLQTQLTNINKYRKKQPFDPNKEAFVQDKEDPNALLQDIQFRGLGIPNDPDGDTSGSDVPQPDTVEWETCLEKFGPPPCQYHIGAWCEGETDENNALHAFCGRYCCNSKYAVNRKQPSAPIVFAYKYSGCKFVWYPREYSFDYDPYVSQCIGYRARGQQIDEDNFTFDVGCHPHNYAVQLSGAPGTDEYQDECSQAVNNDRIAYNMAFPCHCAPYPHIHGGAIDGIENKVNVSLKENSMGYVASLQAFSDPIEIEDIGCCWCASTRRRVPDFFNKGGYYQNRVLNFRNTYPFQDGKGKVPSPESNGPGYNCAGFGIATNPNYQRRCFSRGISPYLLKTSKKNHRMAYEIWGHGEDNGDAKYDFGPTYVGTALVDETDKEIEVSFRKIYNVKTNLRSQYIGMVALTHHFEAYAYRSDDASRTIEMQAIQNNCTFLVGAYEGYGGVISKRGTYYRWTPWKYDSLQWQMRRGTPRRVQYKGSALPLFHFDLVNMEDVSSKKNIVYQGNLFEGTKFLEHYYRYFYSLKSFNGGGCESPQDIPGPPEWDFSHLLNSYDYVIFWLEKMVEEGIIRIKDHAIDISSEVNNIIKNGIIENGEVILPQELSISVGGPQGYLDLINFFGVNAGQENATTPKIIKEKLLNTAGLEGIGPSFESGWIGPSGDQEQFRCFLPRRAKLSIGPSFVGPTAFGFTGDFAEAAFAPLVGNTVGITNASYSIGNNPPSHDIVSLYFNENYKNFLFPVEVEVGLGGGYLIDNSRKLTVIGAAVNGNPSLATDIPFYLTINSLFDSFGDPNVPPVPRDIPEIPDGSVVKLSVTSYDAAIALTDFEGGLCDFDVLPQGTPNLNGANVYSGGGAYICRPSYPFGLPDNFSSSATNPRPDEVKPTNAYRLKTWGSNSNLALFSLASTQAETDFDIAEHFSPDINPEDKKYPGTNTWFIWTDVSLGMRHCAAIDDWGGLFITPQSSNQYNQSSKGMGSSEDTGHNQPGFVASWNVRFNYFPHIPRPGYVSEEDWNQQFYNNLTLPNSCYRKCNARCPYFFTEVGNNDLFSSCRNCATSGAGGGGFGGDDDPPSNPECPTCASTPSPLVFGQTIDPNTGELVEGCFSVDVLYPTLTAAQREQFYDLTPLLLGKYVNYTDNEGTETFVQDSNEYAPRYTKVVCGHYNTLCLTNENRVEMYGSFGQIDEFGNLNESTLVNAFVPQAVKNLAGTYDVTYSGCEIECNGVIHKPILNIEYSAPSNANTVKFMDSSCDYAIVVTNDNTVYVWGDPSMVPGNFNPESYEFQQTAFTSFKFSGSADIKSISAGVNSFYIHYARNQFNSEDSLTYVTYTHTRYSLKNIGTDASLIVQNNPVQSISAGYSHAVVISSTGREAKYWSPNAFADDTLKYQYKNFNTLPAYFRRQAFFHATPGGWDYSKWLYGSICCGVLDNANYSPNATTGHPVSRSDTCSALAYNIYNADDGKNGFNIMKSYSGNPHYIWMRPDWTRLTTQSLEIVGAFSGSDITNDNRCSPDSGIAASPGSIASISNIQSSCPQGYGPVWGESRPMTDKLPTQDRISIIPACYPIPCTSNPTIFTYVNPAPILDGVSEEVDIPPKISYRSTKDTFQSMFVRFGLKGGAGTGRCLTVVSKGVSYFRYAERHYYFAYDRNTDEYRIYSNSPDFLREIAPLQYFPEIDEEQGNTFYPVGCTLCGFGGGTGPDGDGIPIEGYPSLFNYPLTGPNYGLEVSVERPLFVITSPTTYGLQVQIESILCDDTSTGQGGCGTCALTNNGGIADVFDRFVGGGGMMFYSCNRGNACGISVVDGVQRLLCPRTNNFAPLWNLAYYRRAFVEILSGRTLLKGVGSQISKTIDPADDPNFVRKTFIDVLNDSEFTQKETPWFYPNSTKWMPLCWDSPLILPEFEQEEGIISQAPLYLSTDINEENFGYFSAYSSEVTNDQSFSFEFLKDDFEEKQLAGFITELNFPGVSTLKKGIFSYEFYVKAENRYTEILLRAKLFKVDLFNNEIELTGNFTDYSEPVYAESTSFPPDIAGESYKKIVITDYINEDIQLNTTDRLIFKIYGTMRERDGQTVDAGNRIEISFGPNSSTIYYQKFGEIFSLAPCFAGDDEELVGQDPNSVKVVRTIDELGGRSYIVYTSPVQCQLFNCCPTE